MFSYCTSLTSLDLRGFDTSSVSQMNDMFSDSGLQYLDLSSFDTRNVRTFSGIFKNCKDLKIKINNETCANLIKALPSYVTVID